ncbi:MAG: methyltransferase domain-containing protein [Planctomycetaceae bacterium]|nr:methyltransferase domain-containing protein [Planctomycetaceae bacterium]
MSLNDLADIEWEQIACPVCGCPDWRRVRTMTNLQYRTSNEFQLVRCSDCRHVYVNPRPTLDCIGRFYPDDYSPHAEPEADNHLEQKQEGVPWYLSRPVRAIPGLRGLYYWLKETCAEVVPKVDGATPRALELGCAGGRFLETLRDRGWQAEGLEPAERPVAAARGRGFRVHHSPFVPGIYEPGSFDAVFAWMVLEHLHDPCGALREVHRILKPRGWIVFSVPNWGCWEPRALGRYWCLLDPPLHLHQFTPRILRRILTEAGFGQIRVIHQRNAFNLVWSAGLWLREKCPQAQLAQRLLDFAPNPSVRGQLALAPIAKVLAWMRQSGRLTVAARAV